MTLWKAYRPTVNAASSRDHRTLFSSSVDKHWDTHIYPFCGNCFRCFVVEKRSPIHQLLNCPFQSIGSFHPSKWVLLCVVCSPPALPSVQLPVKHWSVALLLKPISCLSHSHHLTRYVLWPQGSRLNILNNLIVWFWLSNAIELRFGRVFSFLQKIRRLIFKSNKKLISFSHHCCQTLYDKKVVKQVDVPSYSGSFGILANHVPCLAVLKPGVVTVYEDDGSSKKYFGTF